MMFTFQTKSPSGEGRKSKRLKISVACNLCKSRKTKCDGARPICGPCLRKKRGPNDCVYRVDDRTSATTSSINLNSRKETTSGNATLDAVLSTSRSNRSPVDELDEDGSLHSGFIPRGSLFGASSGTHLLHQVRNATGSASETRRSQFLSKPLRSLPRLPTETHEEHILDTRFILPTRKAADRLFKLYWDYVDIAYPWLDRPRIENAYEILWAKDGNLPMNETALHCILNLMFSMSCHVSEGESPRPPSHSSKTFFDRARRLMSFELMGIYNFEVIQMLLLTTIYSLHTETPVEGLRNISIAVHIAQELGLHVPATVDAIIDQRERDLARKVWNGCIMMDRIASMTFGCAPKVPQEVAKQGIDAMALSRSELESGNEDRLQPSTMDFYISFCRLHYIIGDVLESLYLPSDSRVNPHQTATFTAVKIDNPLSSSTLTSLFEIESTLCNWSRSLHPHFQMPSNYEDQTPTKHITRQANILRGRYLSVRLLLFRPFLQIPNQTSGQTLAASLYQEEPIMAPVISRYQIKCVNAAGDIIELISRNAPNQTQENILPSQWYSVSYVYMGVIILLAAYMFPQIVQQVSTSRLDDLLQQAYDILQYYKKYPTLASRCSSVLELIQSQIVPQRPSTANPRERDLRGTMQTYTANPIFVQGEPQEGQEVREDFENMNWLEHYTFNWDDWPLFFTQLHGDSDFSPETLDIGET